MVMGAFALTPCFSQAIVISNFTSADSVITNAGTATISYTAAQAYPNGVVIQLTVSKVSGTVAGTCVCMGSNDLYGQFDSLVNAKYTYSNVYSTPNTILSVYTNRDVAEQSKVWVIQPAGYKYYQIFCTGAGTMAANIRAKIVPIK